MDAQNLRTAPTPLIRSKDTPFRVCKDKTQGDPARTSAEKGAEFAVLSASSFLCRQEDCCQGELAAPVTATQTSTEMRVKS